MARSHKDEHLLKEMQQRWGFSGGENSGSNLTPNHNDLQNNYNARTNGNVHEIYEVNSGFNVYGNPVLNNPSKDAVFGRSPNVNNSHYINNVRTCADMNIGGQLMRVYYDENNQPQCMRPVNNINNQYELFNTNQIDHQQANVSGYHHEPIDLTKSSPEFQRDSMSPNLTYNQMPERNSAPKNQNFIDDLLRNWKPNVSGTYSPFGQPYPVNINPDSMHVQNNIENFNVIPNNKPLNQKKPENCALNESGSKKRIVAEVKPMRPTYSDILSKSTKTNQAVETSKKSKCSAVPEQTKVKSNTHLKVEKQQSNPKIISDDIKSKNDKTKSLHISSGSDSGDVNGENDKTRKSQKKPKTKTPKMSRKWSSLDNINSEGNNYEDSKSQFEYIDNSFSKGDGYDACIDESLDNDKDGYIFQESSTETKAKRKPRENRSKILKTTLEKKKPLKSKKNRQGGYIGIVQSHLENWTTVSVKAIAWFFFLLSDICHMSAHLSWDLLSSVVTKSHMSCQVVWRNSKNWFLKLKENRFLVYIDRKLGHTKVGFWRKLKWFKGKDAKGENDPNATTVNIPLPATGEEAMKRLLACKGKDPYSILGVNPKCTDEEIKRYYRRQAFLVHPDKNQQPGAEEAFKILQHAFELIGEPLVREAYDRDRLESKYKEAAWSELNDLLAQLHEKMEYAANTIRCTNCGRRHKRVLTDRPCYAARYCAQCKIRHSAKEGDIWAESGTFGLMVMYYACMDGGVYQITQWASCQKKNLKQLRPDCHAVQYRIVLGNKAAPAASQPRAHDPNLEEFLNNLYTAGGGAGTCGTAEPPAGTREPRVRKPRARRNKV